MTQAYQEGYDAAKNGVTFIDDNPYDAFGTDKDFEDWGEWEEGFFAFMDEE